MRGTPGTARRSLARPLVAAGVLAGLVACQPIDSGVPEGEDQAALEGSADHGAAGPRAALPADLGALLTELSSSAAEWQAGPVVAEVLIDLDGETWREATVTFLAPDADRMLVMQRSAAGTSQLRPTLETLDLIPVPAEALAQVPPPSGDLLGPGDLLEAAAEARADCGIGDVDSVLYATGAPAAWDGESWTEPVAWTATITGGDRSAVVDPRTGEAHPAGCLDTG